jgi:lysozyme
VFNVGTNAFETSTLLKKINSGDYSGAAAEFARWNKITVNGQKVISDGLAYRRQAERDLFAA